jgi:hypothetical protein
MKLSSSYTETALRHTLRYLRSNGIKVYGICALPDEKKIFVYIDWQATSPSKRELIANHSDPHGRKLTPAHWNCLDFRKTERTDPTINLIEYPIDDADRIKGYAISANRFGVFFKGGRDKKKTLLLAHIARKGALVKDAIGLKIKEVLGGPKE